MARKTMKIENPTQLMMSNASFRNIKSPVYRIGEIWKPVTGIPNLQDWYYVSNYGRVYSRFTGLLIKPIILNSGYLSVMLYNKNNTGVRLLVHRLVITTFNPIANPEDFHVNHIDGNKINNHIDNLEWVTRSENTLHAYQTGLMRAGEANNFCKISEATVHEICRLLSMKKYSVKEISEMVNLQGHKSLIHEIKSKRNWKHISKDYDF